MHVPPHLKGILIVVIKLNNRYLLYNNPATNSGNNVNTIPVKIAVNLYNFSTSDCSDQTIGIILY
jgi:hypothetical protein